MYIKVINIKEIDSKSEEQYVCLCYAYDDGICSYSNYNLQVRFKTNLFFKKYIDAVSER